MKEGKRKRCRDRVKQYHQNRTKITMKILPKSKRRMHEDIPTIGCKGSRAIWD